MSESFYSSAKIVLSSHSLFSLLRLPLFPLSSSPFTSLTFPRSFFLIIDAFPPFTSSNTFLSTFLSYLFSPSSAFLLSFIPFFSSFLSTVSPLYLLCILISAQTPVLRPSPSLLTTYFRLDHVCFALPSFSPASLPLPYSLSNLSASLLTSALLLSQTHLLLSPPSLHHSLTLPLSPHTLRSFIPLP